MAMASSTSSASAGSFLGHQGRASVSSTSSTSITPNASFSTLNALSLTSPQLSNVSAAPETISGGGYDWNSDENRERWHGMFANSLEKVLRQVHPSLVAEEEALRYVESLIIRMLAILTAKPAPTTVTDIEDRVLKTFPNPIDKWALAEAQTAVEKGRKKSSLVLPVDKVHPMLKEVLQNKIDDHVTLYLVAVLEYIAADVLKVGTGKNCYFL